MGTVKAGSGSFEGTFDPFEQAPKASGESFEEEAIPKEMFFTRKEQLAQEISADATLVGILLSFLASDGHLTHDQLNELLKHLDTICVKSEMQFPAEKRKEMKRGSQEIALARLLGFSRGNDYPIDIHLQMLDAESQKRIREIQKRVKNQT